MEKDGYHYQEFIDRQSRKGSLGGKARSEQFENRRKEAKVLRKNGLSIREIAKNESQSDFHSKMVTALSNIFLGAGGLLGKEANTFLIQVSIFPFFK